MIEPQLLDMMKLLDLLFEDGTNCKALDWRRFATIEPVYVPYPEPNVRPKCVVRFGTKDFLRHSAGPRQHHFWDMYGDDYLSPELALLALVQAPPPPRVLAVGIKQALMDDAP